VRYHASLAPLTLAATAATLIDRWRGGGSKTMIAATAVATGSAVAMTGYLVRTVNGTDLQRPGVPAAGDVSRW